MTSPRLHPVLRPTKGLPVKLTAVPRAALALVFALVVLCVPSGAFAAPGAGAPGQAWVRVGHFVPGMGSTSIDLKPLDGGGPSITLAGSATYGQVTEYDKLAPGRYTATVRETSAPAGSQALLSRSFEITANDARTVAVLGTASEPRLALLTDDLTPPKAGTARVRLLSASEAADPVTVTAVGGPTIAEDAVLGQATDYATVPAGSWTLQLQGASTDSTVQDVPVMSGSVYTVVVLDSGQTIKAEVVTDAAGAVTAPKGGAKTGGGGTAAVATGDGRSDLALGLGALAVLALGAVVRSRLQPLRVGR